MIGTYELVMASYTSDREPNDGEIRLWQEDDWWIAKDLDTGVTTQGESRQEALSNLDEAVALYRGEIGEPIETWAEEREALEELGIYPDDVKATREDHDDLPEFLR